MANIRIERVNAELAKLISKIVFDLNDPRISSIVTISEVNTSSDLSYAKVKVGVLAEEKVQNEVLDILVKSKGHIRHALTSLVRMRKVPQLVFELDQGFTHSIKINEILKNLNIPKLEEQENTDESN